MASTGMTLANAIASSLLSVALFGSATSISYAVSNQIDWNLFGALVTGGLAGAPLGIPMTKWFARRIRVGRSVFSVIILLVALYILARCASVAALPGSTGFVNGGRTPVLWDSSEIFLRTPLRRALRNQRCAAGSEEQPSN